MFQIIKLSTMAFYSLELYWYTDWSSSYNLWPFSGGAPRMWAEGEEVGVDWSQKSRSGSG